MAKKARSAKQKANDRRLANRSKTVRSNPRSAAKTVSRKRNTRQMLPLDGKEHFVSFAAGSVIGTVSRSLKPLQDRFLAVPFGQFADEAAIAIASTAGWKWGGKIHPNVKKVSVELYRGAIFSSGQQLGSGFVETIFERFTNGAAATVNGNASGSVIIG